MRKVNDFEKAKKGDYFLSKSTKNKREVLFIVKDENSINIKGAIKQNGDIYVLYEGRAFIRGVNILRWKAFLCSGQKDFLLYKLNKKETEKYKRMIILHHLK